MWSLYHWIFFTKILLWLGLHLHIMHTQIVANESHIKHVTTAKIMFMLDNNVLFEINAILVLYIYTFFFAIKKFITKDFTYFFAFYFIQTKKIK